MTVLALRSGLLVIAASLAVLGCGGDSGPSASVARIAVTPSPVELAQLADLPLEIAAFDSDDRPLADASFAFSSSDPSIAIVLPAGVVRSVGPAGTTTVTVSSGTASVTIPVTVTLVRRMIIGGYQPFIIPADSVLQAQGVLLDVTGQLVPDPEYSYSVTPGTLFAISPTGQLSATSPQATGTGTFTVESQGASATATIHVADPAAVESTVVPGSPYGIVVTPAGAILGIGIGGDLYRGQLPSSALTASTLPGGSMYAIATNASGTSAWVIGLPFGGVSELDAATGEVLGEVTGLTGTPLDIDVDAGRVWVGTSTGRVYMIIAVSRAVLKVYATGAAAQRIAVNPFDHRVYVSQTDAGRIAVIDPAAGLVVKVWIVPGGTTSLLFPDAGLLLAGDENRGIRRLDLATGLETTIAVPCGAFHLARSPDGTRLAISCPWRGAVVLLDAPGFAVQSAHVVRGVPRSLAFSPDGSQVLVANEVGQVQFIEFR